MSEHFEQFKRFMDELKKQSEERRREFMKSPERWKTEVIERREKIFNGKTYYLYKLNHEVLGIFWLSERDFEHHKNLYKEKPGGYSVPSDVHSLGKDYHLEFEAPFEEYFILVEKTNKNNRKFKVILPKNS